MKNILLLILFNFNLISAYFGPVFLTMDELKEYNGKIKKQSYVSVNNVIYDITDAKIRKNKPHNIFKPGTDVTNKFESKKNKKKFLKKYNPVGFIVKKGSSLVNAKTKKSLYTAITNEYAALNTYEYIIKRLGKKKPFANILEAEKKHIKILQDLCKKYKVNPIKNTGHKIVENINTYIIAVKTSEIGELQKVRMYKNFISEITEYDIKLAFKKLKNRSQKHLEIFRNELYKTGK